MHRRAIESAIIPRNGGTKRTRGMEHKNQVPNLTPRQKAAKRRELIASIALYAILIACVVLTIVRWRSG